MQDYEKLGVFYLGRYHDLAARATLPDPVLYASSDLTTHALCVGMTGSGKTGLCLDLIEEAAIDGIPAILIDPKGDLANLLLTFPELRPQDFEPWVNPDDARKRGLGVPEFAAQQADLWRNGLAKWGQDGERIRRLRAAAEFAVYTPGSQAGRPVSILGSFAAPPQAVLEDAETFRERVSTTVSGLLGLLGLEVDPLRGREAVFLGQLLASAWQEGRDLTLETLIQEIQTPRFQRVGVMELETFYPARDRFALAMSVNGLLASPGFSAWLEGEPLDIQQLYYTPSGQPRIAIFSIAHLSEAERMFFVTLLLNQLLGWMRAQSGTTSLRALLYMDEIFGYFPPIANPPSKAPLLTLLKQARAYGLGVVLATQNPVDLDYKGLANTGTWFLGRLQTERDKQRVLEGLEGAAVAQGSGFDRSAMEQTLAGLGNRVFLLRNVHEDAPAVFEARWCLSYLRGPMSRAQIKAAQPGTATLASPPTPPPRPSIAPAAARLAQAPPIAPSAPAAPTSPKSRSSARPTLPPDILQFFFPVRTHGGPITYEAMLLGAAKVRFSDARAKIDAVQSLVYLTPIKDDATPVDWSEARELEFDPDELEKHPIEQAQFVPLAPAASDLRRFAAWGKDFTAALFATRKLALLKSARLGAISQPGEAEADFRRRLALAAHERRDAEAARLRAKYAPKSATLQERLRRAEQAVEREAAQARNAKLSSALSFGSTLLGAFLGRKVLSSGNLGRAGSAVRSVGRSVEQSQDVARAGETVDALKQRLAELDAQFQAELATAEAAADPAAEIFETIEIRPAKSGIALRLLALTWTPHQVDAAGALKPAW